MTSIYLQFDHLIPDAPDLLYGLLEGETDATCKRNAFTALSSISHDRALEYLSTVFEMVPNADELLQLVELEFIRKDAARNTQNKVRATCYFLLVWLRFVVAHVTRSTLGKIPSSHI